jgi:hypothetical protein
MESNNENRNELNGKGMNPLVDLELENAALKARIAELEQGGGGEPEPEPPAANGLDNNLNWDENTPELKNLLQEVWNFILNHHIDDLHMTGIDRMRKFGAGERRLGLMEKTYDMSESNPEYFNAPLSSFEGMSRAMAATEFYLNGYELAERIARVLKDQYLVSSNITYAMARMFYAGVQTAARAGDATAQMIFNELRTYYRPMGRGARGGEEPTIDEILKDVKGLAHGRKDGKIVIEHESPHTGKGRHVVIDDAHRPTEGAFKATVTGTVCPHCNTENPEHHRFCCNCGKEL